VIETWAPRGFFLAEAMNEIPRVRMSTSGLTAVGLFCILIAAPGPGFPAQPAQRLNEISNQKTTQALTLQVYKKWIGAAGDETDVEINLFCTQAEDYPSRFINRDRPGGWEISYVPDSGIFCSVYEIEQETFVGDVGDCKDLLMLPGQDVECTIVNTKVVKRIDMLNRYGLFLMIAVMLSAGLAAVRRFGSF